MDFRYGATRDRMGAMKNPARGVPPSTRLLTLDCAVVRIALPRQDHLLPGGPRSMISAAQHEQSVPFGGDRRTAFLQLLATSKPGRHESQSTDSQSPRSAESRV